MSRHKLLIARFPYGDAEHPDVADWLCYQILALKKDERIGEIVMKRWADTPITMTRNAACKYAKKEKCDLVLMVDSDMGPDAYCQDNPNKHAVDVSAKPFIASSLDFMLRPGQKPCVVAAPYCGPPPESPVYAFEWRKKTSDNPDNNDFSLEMYTRETAARFAGVAPVAALATGLVLFDIRVLESLKPPYFDYQYEDEEETEKSTTEDVFWSRNLNLAGVDVFVNWDAWAIHHKRCKVGRPILFTDENVRDEFRAALERRPLWGKKAEKIVNIQPGYVPDLPQPKEEEKPPTLVEACRPSIRSQFANQIANGG